MKGLRLDYPVLSALQPRLVYASISGYGQDGPRALKAGHDINYLAYAGVLDQTGVAGGPPALCNLQIADLLGGAASAAIPILACLLKAQRTGAGSCIDVAMAEAALAHNIFALHALEQHGQTLPRGEDLLTGGVPAYGVYGTSDGRWLAVGALEEKFWRLLCATLGRDDLAPLGLATGAEGTRVRRELQTVLGARTLAEWTRVFRDVDCCVTPILTLDEALRDEHFVARGMVTRGEGMTSIGPAFRVEDLPRGTSAPSPAHGEHSREVLASAGVPVEDIEALVAAGVVRAARADA
jgi:crotonobetainyl-CoA:carnitine CoA-transferase CaiB-like acyl-CoA transferase